MSDIRNIDSSDKTRYATGINNHFVTDDRRQVGVRLTVDAFKRVKSEAISRKVSMGEVIRQLIDEAL